MDRRSLLAMVAAAAAVRGAHAQAPQVRPLVGWLGLASEEGDRRVLAAFRKGLAETGRIDGRTVGLVYRHADGRMDRLPGLIAEMEALTVDLYLAGGRAVARALVAATQKPIVAVRLPADDTALYASIARPGGNLTGFSNFSEELAPKRLQILKDLLPGVSEAAIMHAPDAPNGFDFGAEAEEAARAVGLRTIRLRLRTPAAEETAVLIRSLRPRGIRTLIVVQDFVTISAREHIGRVALEEGVATITDEREFAEQGALLSFGADVPDLFRRSATYIDRIIKGARPGELPIQLASKFELVLNLKTARGLGLNMPRHLIDLADELIE